MLLAVDAAQKSGRSPDAPREIGDDEIAATIRKTLETRPKGATHWSLGTMAKETRPRTLDGASHLACVRASASHEPPADADARVNWLPAPDANLR
jgi:hypothetical protein